MADPEISRRCRFCGASIRVRGFFCPQCGNATSEQPTGSAGEERSPETEEVMVPPDTVPMDLSRLPIADVSNRTASGNAETVPLYPLPVMSEASGTPPADTETVSAPQPTSIPAAVETDLPVTGARPRSMSQVPADVKRGLGKVRELSTVMLDEAAYDPSARFVLVAAVLFILFLIILILSEMMR